MVQMGLSNPQAIFHFTNRELQHRVELRRQRKKNKFTDISDTTLGIYLGTYAEHSFSFFLFLIFSCFMPLQESLIYEFPQLAEYFIRCSS